MEQVQRAIPERAEQKASAGRQLVGGPLPTGGGRSGRRKERWGQVSYLAIRTTPDDLGDL